VTVEVLAKELPAPTSYDRAGEVNCRSSHVMSGAGRSGSVGRVAQAPAKFETAINLRTAKALVLIFRRTCWRSQTMWSN